MTEVEKTPARVAIIGAGLSGISTALSLQKRGFHDFIIYDRYDEIGGTWVKNAYPGCRSDVPAILYSHSENPNPDWTQTHPPRDELKAYWLGVVKKNGVDEHIVLQHTLRSANWDPSTSSWHLEFDTPTGKVSVNHNILVSATGGFSFPSYPNVPGLNTFKGPLIHTATWPEDLTLDQLRGKSVLVVGNGCSGVQVVAAMARDPEINITHLSRSHQWLVPSPAGDQAPHSVPYTAFHKWWHHIRFLFRLGRILQYFKGEWNYVLFFSRIGKTLGLRKGFGKIVGTWMRNHAPPHLKDVIVPTFDFGAKRLVMDGKKLSGSGYMWSINQPNVNAIWDHLGEVTPDHVVTRDGQILTPEVVVLATGYDLSEGFPFAGRDGHVATDRTKLRAYNGHTMYGFPNFFALMGPNTASGHTSICFYSEVQAEYIAQCVLAMEKNNIKVIEVKKDALEKYNRWLDRRLDKSVWGQAKHYYRDNGGTGRVFSHFPGSTILFWWINWWVVWDDYHGAESLARKQTRVKTALAAALVAISSTFFWIHSTAP